MRPSSIIINNSHSRTATACKAETDILYIRFSLLGRFHRERERDWSIWRYARNNTKRICLSVLAFLKISCFFFPRCSSRVFTLLLLRLLSFSPQNLCFLYYLFMDPSGSNRFDIFEVYRRYYGNLLIYSYPFYFCFFVFVLLNSSIVVELDVFEKVVSLVTEKVNFGYLFDNIYALQAEICFFNRIKLVFVLNLNILREGIASLNTDVFFVQKIFPSIIWE